MFQRGELVRFLCGTSQPEAGHYSVVLPPPRRTACPRHLTAALLQPPPRHAVCTHLLADLRHPRRAKGGPHACRGILTALLPTPNQPPRRLTYDTPAGRKEVRTRTVALTVPAYVAADLVADKAPAAADALKVS